MAELHRHRNAIERIVAAHGAANVCHARQPACQCAKRLVGPETPFVRQRLGSFFAKLNYDDLVVLKQLIEAGKVTSVIDRTYPLSQTSEAISYVEAGHARGKVVITL